MKELKRIQNKEILAMVVKTVAQGARLQAKGQKHVQVLCPWRGTERCGMGSGIVTVSTTPEDFRASRKAKTDLRRCGYDL